MIARKNVTEPVLFAESLELIFFFIGTDDFELICLISTKKITPDAATLTGF